MEDRRTRRRAIMVHAKGRGRAGVLRTLYPRFGFERSPNDPLRLFLLMKDIKASIESE